MPSEIMQNLVESERRGLTGRSLMMKAISAAIQIAVIGALIVIPLLATDTMPSPPEVMMTFAAPPPPPPPPPAPPAARTPVKPAKASIPKPTALGDFIAPVDVPMEIPVEDFAFAESPVGGIETGGFPGGALGGVEGGVPGGPITEPLRVGGEIQPPKKVKDVRPDYPPTARSARVEGTVVLEAVIDARGVVADVRVLKSIPLLDEAAIDAVKQWRYQATMLNGQAVPIVMTVTLIFGLEKA